MYRIPDEVWQLMTKTIIPALVAVSVGIAVKMKRKRISLLSALTSYVIGVGFAFLFGVEIHEHFDPGAATIFIGMIAITGEKIGHWLIFTFKFDKIGDGIMDKLMKWLGLK